ncbi:hypothetical protein EVAR_89326_1 [Eumeta japonica]|uniref:Uncharacterized protein n=1 Tax=Eumeta variegata TaxID=151549 RepID=A0A4C1Z1M9_EUMVA|nr:hypothetical protein EVAR_89326_1 [Eumeta japonica]
MPPETEKSIRKMEVITSPSEYVDLIREHSTVTKLEDIEVLDWKTAVHDVVKTTAQLHFKISQCKRFLIRRSKKSGNVMVWGENNYNSNSGTAKSICKKKQNSRDDPAICDSESNFSVYAVRRGELKKIVAAVEGEWHELKHVGTRLLKRNKKYDILAFTGSFASVDIETPYKFIFTLFLFSRDKREGRRGREREGGGLKGGRRKEGGGRYEGEQRKGRGIYGEVRRIPVCEFWVAVALADFSQTVSVVPMLPDTSKVQCRCERERYMSKQAGASEIPRSVHCDVLLRISCHLLCIMCVITDDSSAATPLILELTTKSTPELPTTSEQSSSSQSTEPQPSTSQE